MTDEQFLERLSLAVGLRKTGYYKMAEQLTDDLVKVRPNESSLWHTRGQIHTELGEFDAALADHHRTLDIMDELPYISREQFQMASMAYGQCLMRQERFLEAWPYWEQGRFEVSWSPWPGSRPLVSPPPDGVSIDSLLVQSEGGYGDFFMNMRWLRLLKQRFSIGRVGLMIWRPLARFADWREMGVDEIHEIGHDKLSFAAYEYSTSIMSLPALFGVRSYSDIPPVRVDRVRWEQGKTFRLGFCWRAEENSSPVRTKSLPLEVAEKVARWLPGRKQMNIYSLSPEKKDLYSESEVIQPAGTVLKPECMTTWKDTAGYICFMDFILTVDTAVAHLSGLLGVPALVLLPRSSCWRWGDHRRLSGPWYGPQMTYYRQPVALDWRADDILEATLERINGYS